MPFDRLSEPPGLACAVDDQCPVFRPGGYWVHATEQSIHETALETTDDEDVGAGREFDGVIGARLDNPGLDRSLTQRNQFGEVVVGGVPAALRGVRSDGEVEGDGPADRRGECVDQSHLRGVERSLVGHDADAFSGVVVEIRDLDDVTGGVVFDPVGIAAQQPL